MDKFVVLSMTKESKDIAKVLSNKTAINILNKLADKRMSTTEISNKLNIPLSTVQYNVDLLKKANLIKDTAYKYSEKGKKILYYEPAKKTIILAPEKEKESVLNTIKNNFIIPLVLAVSAGMGFLGQFFMNRETQVEVAAASAAESTMPVKDGALKAVNFATEASKPFYQQFWFIFFLGALFATIVLSIIYFRRKK